MRKKKIEEERLANERKAQAAADEVGSVTSAIGGVTNILGGLL